MRSPNDAHHELTEYEKQRLAHVARNREYMARLGVANFAASIGLLKQDDDDAAKSQTKSKSRSKKAKTNAVPTRRSSRMIGEKPTYTGARIDAMRDEEDENEDEDADGAERRRRRRGASSKEEERSDERYVATSREWLQEAREKLLALRAESGELAVGGKGGGCRERENASWRRDAEARWGEDIPVLGAVKDWKAWTESRLGKPPPCSALQLLQEYYAHDAWQLLIACALMSRVASGPLKHECISNFFEKFPTPTAALKANPDDVFEVIKRLGLFPGRMRTIVEVSSRFLTHTDALEIGLDADVKIYGIGEFGVDSFEIFARGDIHRKPKDANLSAFCAWQRRHGARTTKDGGIKIEVVDDEEGDEEPRETYA